MQPCRPVWHDRVIEVSVRSTDGCGCGEPRIDIDRATHNDRLDRRNASMRDETMRALQFLVERKLRILLPHYTVPVSMSDASVPNAEFALRAQEVGLSVEPVASVANALMLLRDTWDAREQPPRILIGGSLYLAGAVLAENGTPPA